MAAAETKVETVTMNDGRVVDFPGKRKMLKTSTISAAGDISVQLDFRNGETRTYHMSQELKDKFAAHGAEQKLGDQIAGLKGKDGGEPDIEDAVFAIDELLESLDQKRWTISTPGAGLAGVSVLAKALAEAFAKTPEQIKAYLAKLSHAEKVAIRSNPKIKPIVDRLEAEKAAKASKKTTAIDTDAKLAELGEMSDGLVQQSAMPTV